MKSPKPENVSSQPHPRKKTRKAAALPGLARYEPTDEGPQAGETLHDIARPKGMTRDAWHKLDPGQRALYVAAYNRAVERRNLPLMHTAAAAQAQARGELPRAAPALVSAERWEFLHRVAAAMTGVQMYAGIAAYLAEQLAPALREVERKLSDRSEWVPTARKDGVIPAIDDRLWAVAVHALPPDVPRLELPRDKLEDLVRAVQYLLYSEKSFDRFHEERERGEGGRCLECGKKLVQGKRKYCSKRCTDNYLQRRHRAAAWAAEWGKRYHVTMGTPEDPQPIEPASVMRPPWEDPPKPKRGGRKP